MTCVRQRGLRYNVVTSNVQAMLENADISTSEVKKDYYEFKRDVVGGERNFRAGKSVTEKVMRFLEEKMREKVFQTKLSVNRFFLNDLFLSRMPSSKN